MMSSRSFVFCSFLALAACSGNDVSNTLGLNKSAPDEFVVVSRPPLSVPPDFELKPPRPGEESPHAVSTQEQARKLLLGTDGKNADGSSMSMDEFMRTPSDEPSVETAVTPVIAEDAPTAASASFLQKVGANDASPSIRDDLRTDAATPRVTEKEADSLYEELIGSEQQETLVDPAKESERLRTNKDEGKPVTEGETPTKDPTPKSVIDKVF